MTAAPAFAPPEDAVSLYVGSVMHARLKPVQHRFTYKVFSLLVDIDRLEAADRASRLFSVGRFNLASFYERDHGAGGAIPLGTHVRRLLARGGLELPGGRILLLCYPRILGYVFNPLATYWCYDVAGALKAVVYEVSNTFGERHAYVAPVEDGELSDAGLRQSREKLLYVSPFLDMGMRYAFRLRPPGDAVRLRILESDSDGPILSATFAGERREVTSAALAKLCLALPLMTIKVMAGIHFEAARLWFKGLRLADRPAPPGVASFGRAVRHGAVRASAPTPTPIPQETIASR